MNEVRELRRRAGLTQAALARAAGTSQAAIAAYERGRKSPNLDTLKRLGAAVGYALEVDWSPDLTREDRRSLLLHAAIAGRLQDDSTTVLSKARSTLELMRMKHPGAATTLAEWDRILAGPVQEIVSVLVDPTPHARELRHVTPFAGVLSASERADVYREFARRERTS